MVIDKNKNYRTRDGREVRIYATDHGSLNNVVCGAIKDNGIWFGNNWLPNGHYLNMDTETNSDLIEVKPRIRREYWVNVYSDHVGKLFESRAMANTNTESERIACVKVVIDCAEGDGL